MPRTSGDLLPFLVEEGADGGGNFLRLCIAEAVNLILTFLRFARIEGFDDLRDERDVIFGAADQEAVRARINRDGQRDLFVGAENRRGQLGLDVAVWSADGLHQSVLNGSLGGGGATVSLEAEQAGEDICGLARIGILERDHFDFAF